MRNKDKLAAKKCQCGEKPMLMFDLTGQWHVYCPKCKTGVQVYFSPKDRENLVITFVDNEKCSWITEEGKVGIDSQKWLESCILKVEYPTWQEAIKWEFKK